MTPAQIIPSEPECENRMLPLLVVFVGACLLLSGLAAIAWGLWSSTEYVVHGLARLHGELR